MHSKIVTLASLCLFAIMSITLADDSDGFVMESTRALMAPMRRSIAINGKQFILASFLKVNWFRAAHICKYNGMELASINSEAEQDVAAKLLDGSGVDGSIWISGNDLGSVKNWYWLLNGRPIHYFNWNAGEPNNFSNLNERCISLTPKVSQYRWNDSLCDNKFDFLCEAKYCQKGCYTNGCN